MMAPSAGNSRPWEFVVLENQEIRERIVEVHPYGRPILEAPLAIVICGLPDIQGGKLDGYWPQDCGAAAENILLQALELGYGTCWCGIYPRLERMERVRELLGVTSTPLGAIAVGIPDETPEARGSYEESKVRYIR